MTNSLKLSEVARAIRSLGMTYAYHEGEFRIDYKRDDYRKSDDSAYFTTDRDDAVNTAQVMSEWGNK